MVNKGLTTLSRSRGGRSGGACILNIRCGCRLAQRFGSPLAAIARDFGGQGLLMRGKLFFPLSSLFPPLNAGGD